jgi:hypothetical protein
MQATSAASTIDVDFIVGHLARVNEARQGRWPLGRDAAHDGNGPQRTIAAGETAHAAPLRDIAVTRRRLRHMRIDMRAGLLALAVAAGTVGCGNKAEEAKMEADKKAAEAAKSAKEADDKAASAKKEADDKAAKANTEAKAKLQKDVDAADRKATYLKEKAAKATGATKKNADAAVTELDTRRAAAKASIAKLDTATGAGWDAAKTAAESDIAALNKAVESLETTLKSAK